MFSKWARLVPRPLFLSSRFLIALLVFILTQDSRLNANETSEPIWGVSVEDVVATPADTGGTSKLHFRVDNFSGRTIAIIGVRSSLSASGALVMQNPDLERSEDIPVLIVLDQEILNLRSSYIWAELRELKEPIRLGDYISFDLVLRDTEVPVEAHVHTIGMHPKN